MKNNKQEIWVGVEDRTNDPSFLENVGQEFRELPIVDTLAEEETLNVGSSRRDFLKYLGFGLGAATLAASCDIPVKRAVPYVVKPDAIVPGVATYYASSFVKGGDYCSVLVKTREGRPIKIEGNSLSKVTMGGTNARAQASVLDIYDRKRYQAPGKPDQSETMSWADLDKTVKGQLNAGSNIVIITNTILSPTTKKAIDDFKAKFGNTSVFTYDPVSSSAMLEANADCFGQQVVPNYHFDKADVIVSVGADFLGTWISPIEYAAQYVKNRKIEKVSGAKMSRHIQVESGMSMTGSNADNRILIKPSEQGAAIATLYNEVAALTGGTRINAPSVNSRAAKQLAAVAKELTAKRGQSLVVSGSNNVGEQTLVNKINDLLGNYGRTIDFAEASMQRQGIDGDIKAALAAVSRADAVFVMDGANPVFDLPNGAQFAEAMASAKLKVSFASIKNETAAICDYVAPTNNFLESWGDAMPKRGHYSLIQPTISPLFKTRETGESLLVWADSPALQADAEQPYYEYLKAHWEAAIFPQQSDFQYFQTFWDMALHDGVVSIPQAGVETIFNGDVSAAAGKINKPENSELEIVMYETINAGAGQYANNPWLQELPDPVMRTVWGNYISVPVEYNNGDVKGFMGIGKNAAKGKAELVNIDVNGISAKMTAVAQFGQAPGTVAVGLGYGRTIVGETGLNIGTHVSPWCSYDSNGNLKYYAGVSSIELAGTDREFACVQYHHTYGVTARDESGKALMNPDNPEEKLNVDEEALAYQGALTDRSVMFTTNMNKLADDVATLKAKRETYQKLNSHSLYGGHEYKYDNGHHWAMNVDLNACIGCGACAVACMAENNVPVVGKTEVHRHHEMAWIRIDRYFYGDVENPNVVYQPLMCQHCDNAPCENVCPVAATNHSAEGLNQMTYNRCIGTRYCANNCPYKVRRYNWLDYTTADVFPGNQPLVNGEELPYGADNLTRMVLNPDVTVRSRGVIEKCSFCVQRIQEGKLTAKRENRRLTDSDVKTACQTACPTGAIVFGDINNKEALISQKIESDMAYRVLEEVNTESSVHYFMKVNNRDEQLDEIVS